ncbi:DUF6660 family protein [Polluticaenibacter yanchengensis]
MFYCIPIALFTIFAIVKFFAFIMSWYMIVLSMVPCDDVPAFTKNIQTNIPTISACTDMHDKHNHIEMCSPLCAGCTCCATIVVNTHFICYNINLPVSYIEKVEIDNSQPLQYRAATFWQPPKI